MDNVILLNSNDLRQVIHEELEKVFKEQIFPEKSSFDDGKWLTRDEVCDLLRITFTTLWRMERRGEILAHKVGRRKLYSKTEIGKFFK